MKKNNITGIFFTALQFVRLRMLLIQKGEAVVSDNLPSLVMRVSLFASLAA